jgi:bifunctional non-homologous end joining protein LigD
MSDQERTLVAFLGGRAATGAMYKIEVIKVASGLQADAYNAGGSGSWKHQGLVERSGNEVTVLGKALRKFSEKTKSGRDRTYNRPLAGGDPCMPLEAALIGGRLPDHPLCWQVGQSLAKLPQDLRHRAVLEDGQQPEPAGLAVAQIITSPAVGARPSRGQLVMLCETIPDRATLQVLLRHDLWIATEKMEGDRAQLHHEPNGRVYMTNRSGGVVNCPPHIVQAMAQLPRGLSLDGEIITVDEQLRPQLYVGARATINLFIAFDLLHHPGSANVMHFQQRERLRMLETLVPQIRTPVDSKEPGIRMVRWAEDEGGKLELYEEIQARDGEGLVLRNALSSYQNTRSQNWMRWRDREKEMDVVVLGYKKGSGKFAKTVGGVEVGLYDGTTVRSIGWVGSGWSDALRGELLERWQRSYTGYVITIKSFGLSFADQVIRPSGVRIRTEGDKLPGECTFELEAGRPYGAMAPALV